MRFFNDYQKIVLIVMTNYISGAVASDLWFPPALVNDANDELVADLSHFESGKQLPGVYSVDVFLNETFLFSEKINFIESHEYEKLNIGKAGLVPCLDQRTLDSLTLKKTALEKVISSGNCNNIINYIDGVRTDLTFQKMQLHIIIPQSILEINPRGWISPEQWDDGIRSTFFSYNYSGSSYSGGSDARSNYLQINSGINISSWRFRDSRVFNDYKSNGQNRQQWQHNYSYFTRNIIPWGSRITIGDSTTEGDIFDSVSFSGVQLNSDDEQNVESQKGYAPIINGIAKTNATVSVSQNGYVVYQMNVAPGNFSITDLNPLYTSGDLIVNIIEADGQINQFTVPYSSVPMLLRKDTIKYYLTAGTLRNNSSNYNSNPFQQGSFKAGLTDGITGYGGALNSQNYLSFLVGSAFNMGGAGAVSSDITQANTKLADNSRHQGQSWRFIYAKTLNSIGTTFQLASYRYSTKGFYTLNESALKHMAGNFNEKYYDLNDNKRQKIELNVTQKVGDSSSIYVTGNRQTYWNKGHPSDSLQLGFNSSLGRLSYQLSFSHERSLGGYGSGNSMFLNLSMPVGNSNSLYSSLGLAQDSNGTVTQHAGLSGYMLDNNVQWSLGQMSNLSSNSDSDGGALNVNYDNTYGKFGGGYSYTRGYKKASYNMSGSVLLHSGGVTLGQPLGTSSALVYVPESSNVPILNSHGIQTDYRGYAILPWVSSYRENKISLDASSLDDQTEISKTVLKVTPTRGAIVKASFEVQKGARVLFTINHNNKPLPFGTIVSSPDGTYIVGDDGEVFISGLKNTGILHAQWGKGSKQQCSFAFDARNPDMESMLKVSTTCN